MKVTGPSFNTIYRALIKELLDNGTVSTSRKGKHLTELHNAIFEIKNPMDCMATCRDMSAEYLTKEMDFYMSGSDRLEDAVECSPFWKGCSDDGETINSNYGKLIFHDRNLRGNTQFEHALACLKNARGSKKAVMTLYNKEHAYISNDNPCTMYLHARIDGAMRLHLTATMRSSDIYYGLPYDVPFFVFVQIALVEHLRNTYPEIQLGTYTHIANSLHFYEYKRDALLNALNCGSTLDKVMLDEDVYKRLVHKHLKTVRKLVKTDWMAIAWEISELSKCYKKKVGCALVFDGPYGEELIATGYGDISSTRDRSLCAPRSENHVCSRDDENDLWFETGCPSIHSEHRALDNLRKKFWEGDYSYVTCYVTHGPCDACLKMLELVGITKVVYDVPYKTNYDHWPNMEIAQCSNPTKDSPDAKPPEIILMRGNKGVTR